MIDGIEKEGIRVCVLTTTFPRWPNDSCGSFISQSVESLAAAGVTVKVLTPHYPGAKITERWNNNIEIFRFLYTWPPAMEQVAQAKGGLPYTLRKSIIAQVEFPIFCLCFLCKGYLVARSCDIIHAHWILAGAVAFLLKKITGLPYILSLRGTDVNKLLKGKLWKVFRPVLKNASYLLAVSNDFKQFVEKRAERDGFPLKVNVLENGVDIDVFLPMDKIKAKTMLGFDEKAKLILFAGRLVPGKGIDCLINAFAYLYSKYADVHLVILGDGPFAGYLKELVRKSGLEDKVHFKGDVPHKDIPLWLGASFVVVLPSYSEGRPNIILEAMAAGIPVVASRIPGVTEIIIEGVGGLLFSPGNVEELKEKLSVLLSNDEFAAKLGKGGRASIIKRNLTWQGHAEKLRSIYREVLRP